MRLIDADELKDLLGENITVLKFNQDFDGLITEIIDNAPTIELTASFMRQQAEDELIRIRAEADQRGYERGYRFGLETGLNLKRPTGRWIYHKADGYFLPQMECSVCGASDILEGITPQRFRKFYLYCWNCGAKMKGENYEAD